MPGKTDAWGEVVFSVCECLPVVAQANIKCEVVAYVNAVLNKNCIEPLWQIVAADSEINWLSVVLDIGKSQLAERSSGRIFECEGAENSCAGLAACSSRSVLNDAAAKS